MRWIPIRTCSCARIAAKNLSLLRRHTRCAAYVHTASSIRSQRMMSNREAGGREGERFPRGRNLLILVGASGRGKTVIGKRAAEAAGWSLVDTDAEILTRAGTASINDIFESGGEAQFREFEAECMLEVVR